MGKLLNTGYIAIIVAGVVRYLMARNSGMPFFEMSMLQKWELWFYGASIFWFLLAFWNTFIRRRCPECRSSEYSFNGSEEIDRWVGSKKVREKVGKDTYADRHVTTTFAKIRSDFQCLKCGNSWSEAVKQEVK